MITSAIRWFRIKAIIYLLNQSNLSYLQLIAVHCSHVAFCRQKMAPRRKPIKRLRNATLSIRILCGKVLSRIKKIPIRGRKRDTDPTSRDRSHEQTRSCEHIRDDYFSNIGLLNAEIRYFEVRKNWLGERWVQFPVKIHIFEKISLTLRQSFIHFPNSDCSHFCFIL